MNKLLLSLLSFALLLLLALAPREAESKTFKLNLGEICRSTPQVVDTDNFEDCMAEFRRIEAKQGKKESSEQEDSEQQEDDDDN